MSLMPRRHILLASLLLVSVSFPLVPSRAQNQIPAKPSQRSWLQDPAVKDEYKKWLREDVAWIITDEERADFRTLSTDKQRDEFVVAFWDRRNPMPGATENKFKEEHYRRLAYTNTHFAVGIPGWKSDRGRIYIMYGTPDSIDSHPLSSPPSEVWHYVYIEGIGQNVVFTFFDQCRCGNFSLTDGELDSIPRTFGHKDPQ